MILKALITRVNKIYDGFNKINECFIIIVLAVMCLDIFIQVLSRYVLGIPLTWSEELARYLFVWIALMGAAWCGRSHIHVRMTVVVNMLPPAGIRVVQTLVSAICAVTCIYLFPYACQIFMAQSKLKAVTLGVSLGIEYIAAPVGIFLMALQWTVDLLFALFDWEGYKARYMPEEEG